MQPRSGVAMAGPAVASNDAVFCSETKQGSVQSTPKAAQRSSGHGKPCCLLGRGVLVAKATEGRSDRTCTCRNSRLLCSGTRRLKPRPHRCNRSSRANSRNTRHAKSPAASQRQPSHRRKQLVPSQGSSSTDAMVAFNAGDRPTNSRNLGAALLSAAVL